MDVQANLTTCLGYAKDEEPHVGQWLKEEVPFKDLVKKTFVPNLSLINSSLFLADFDKRLKMVELNRRIQEIQGMFDVVLIDSPPALSTITSSILLAADSYIVPLVANDYLAFDGLDSLVNYANTIKEQHNPELQLEGILLTKYNPKININVVGSLVSHLKDSYPGKVFDSYIRNNVAVVEAQLMKKELFEDYMDSNAAKDYQSLAKEIIDNQ
jgi:chromosome partitioning protein